MRIGPWVDINFRLFISPCKDLARNHEHRIRIVPSGRGDDAELPFRPGTSDLFEYRARQGPIFRPFISEFCKLVLDFVSIARQELRPGKELRPTVSVHGSEQDL